MMRNRFLKDIVLPAAIVVGGFAALIFLSGRIDATHPQLAEGYEDTDLSLSGSRLKGFAFGTEGLIADWYWMRALQYIGDKMLKQPDGVIDLEDLSAMNPRLLYPLLNNATDLDPHFIAAYSYGAIVLPAIDKQKAIDLTRKGIENNPDSWRLYQHLAYIYWKLKRYDEAAQTYERGSQIEGAPPFMRLMAASMKTQGGSRETARTIYREMLAASDDEQVRITAQRRLMELDSLDEREIIDRALSEFKQRNGRCANAFAEVLPALADAPLPGGHDLRINAAKDLVDPSGAPYLLDREKCRAMLDISKTSIALQ
jgi:tetratricopeptide (TPR) repeat protein